MLCMCVNGMEYADWERFVAGLEESLGIESCSRENQDLFSRLISKKMSRGRERKQGRRERRSKEVSECPRDWTPRRGGGAGFMEVAGTRKSRKCSKTREGKRWFPNESSWLHSDDGTGSGPGTTASTAEERTHALRFVEVASFPPYRWHRQHQWWPGRERRIHFRRESNAGRLRLAGRTRRFWPLFPCLIPLWQFSSQQFCTSVRTSQPRAWWAGGSSQRSLSSCCSNWKLSKIRSHWCERLLWPASSFLKEGQFWRAWE